MMLLYAYNDPGWSRNLFLQVFVVFYVLHDFNGTMRSSEDPDRLSCRLPFDTRATFQRWTNVSSST